jgi:hypothetical protein
MPAAGRLRAALAAVLVRDRAREGGYAVAVALVGISPTDNPVEAEYYRRRPILHA